MSDHHQQSPVNQRGQSVAMALDEESLVECMDTLLPVSTKFEAADLEDILSSDESDVTSRPYMASRQNQSQTDHYSIFKGNNVVAHLFIDGAVTTDGSGVLFPNGVYYDFNLHVLSLNKNQLQIPANGELGIDEHEIGVVLRSNEDPVIISFSKGAFQIKRGPTSLQWLDVTKGYLDDRGVLAFDLAEGIAVVNLQERMVKSGSYRAMFNPLDLPLKIVGKGLQFGDRFRFDFQKGVIHIGSNAIKVPQQSMLNFNETGMDIQVNTSTSIRRLSIDDLDRYVQISVGGCQFLLPHRVNLVLDKQGNLAFELDHQLVIIDLFKAQAQIGGVEVCFSKGTTLQVVRGMLKFQENVFLHVRNRLLRYGESRVVLPKKAQVNLSIDQLRLSVKNKEISMRPYNKQIFIRVGGKLIVLTVTVGIAVDQNGNLAFDYKGNFTIMDTNFMVLNINGVKFDMSKAKDVVVEMIGMAVIVSAQAQPNNFMEQFKQMMDEKGLLDLIKDGGGGISPEDLVELLMSVSDPKELQALLQQAGISPDGALQDCLKELLTKLGDKEPSALMMMKSGLSGAQLQVGDRTIALPSPLEMTEAISVGGVEAMVARIKGNHVHLKNLT